MLRSAIALSTTLQYYPSPSKTADTGCEIRASWRNNPDRTGQVTPRLHPPISRRPSTETRCRGHTTGQTPYESERQSERSLSKYIRKIGGYLHRTLADKAHTDFPASYHRLAPPGLFQTDSLMCQWHHLGYIRMTVRPHQ